MTRVFSRRGKILAASGLFLLALWIAACEHEQPGSGPSAAPAGSAASSVKPSAPVVSRWPPGLQAAILRHDERLLVVEESGGRFEIPFPGAAGPAQKPSAAARYVDLAVTDNGQYLAYRFWGGPVTVCSTRDGGVKSSAPVELHDEIEAVSSDGRFVFLVNQGKEPGIWGPEKLVDERVAIVDTTTGERLNMEAVQSLVTGRDHRLRLVGWSAHHQAFLLQVETEPCAVYTYDPAQDSLAQVPGIDAFRAVSESGLIVGASGSKPPHGGGLAYGRPVVWDGEAPMPVVGLESEAYGVAISSDGSTLVFDVMLTKGEETVMGWQSFRRTKNEWRADSSVFRHPLNYARLIRISEDNRTAWGTTLAGSSRQPDYQLVSLDLETGRWNEWFGDADVRSDLRGSRLEIPLLR